MNFSKELIPAFTLEYQYFDKLRHIRDIAIYAQIEKLRYANLPISDENMAPFCTKMGISAEEAHDSFQLLMDLGLITKGI